MLVGIWYMLAVESILLALLLEIGVSTIFCYMILAVATTLQIIFLLILITLITPFEILLFLSLKIMLVTHGLQTFLIIVIKQCLQARHWQAAALALLILSWMNAGHMMVGLSLYKNKDPHRLFCRYLVIGITQEGILITFAALFSWQFRKDHSILRYGSRLLTSFLLIIVGWEWALVEGDEISRMIEMAKKGLLMIGVIRLLNAPEDTVLQLLLRNKLQLGVRQSQYFHYHFNLIVKKAAFLVFWLSLQSTLFDFALLILYFHEVRSFLRWIWVKYALLTILAVTPLRTLITTFSGISQYDWHLFQGQFQYHSPVIILMTCWLGCVNYWSYNVKRYMRIMLAGSLLYRGIAGSMWEGGCLWLSVMLMQI